MIENNMLKTVIKAADDKRAEDIVVLDMQGISLITDYLLVCHGNSDKQIQAIAREIKDQANELGIDIKRMEGYDEARWILVDLGDVVAHIFHKEDRAYYKLERLWGDAKVVDIQGELS